MSIDYDLPRVADPAADSDSLMVGLGTLKVDRGLAATQVQEELELAENEPLELPGFGLTDEELVVAVVPRRADEFTCAGCFLGSAQEPGRSPRRRRDAVFGLRLIGLVPDQTCV